MSTQNTSVITVLDHGKIWKDCVCTDTNYLARFPEFVLRNWLTVGNIHRGYCRYCNKSHDHTPRWNVNSQGTPSWDGNPERDVHRRTCTFPTCNQLQGQNHVWNNTLLGPNDPDRTTLHDSRCTSCNLSVQSTHIGFTWRVLPNNNRHETANPTVCEERVCGPNGCGLPPITNPHNFTDGGLRVITRDGTMVSQQFGTHVGDNPALDLNNTHHIITMQCRRCARRNPNFNGGNILREQHTMSPGLNSLPWRSNGMWGCIRSRVCTAGCGQSQSHTKGHRWRSGTLYCEDCQITAPHACWRDGHTARNNVGAAWHLHWNVPETHCRIIPTICTHCSGAMVINDVAHTMVPILQAELNHIRTNLGAPQRVTHRCERCGRCNAGNNAHWLSRNILWVNNGQNEVRSGRCGTPGCPFNGATEFRSHDWNTTWINGNSPANLRPRQPVGIPSNEVIGWHWQQCTSCATGGTNNIAFRVHEPHNYGSWFFWEPDNDTCQQRFEACICKQPTPPDEEGYTTKRPHIYDANRRCTRPGCTWTFVEPPVEPITWCPFCNNEGDGCHNCNKNIEGDT
jgi:hypothetical protein